MADTYQILGAQQTDELLGGGKTTPAMLTTARAIPSGVIFQLVIAKVDYTPQRLELILPTVAAALNKAADVPGVASINVYQDVNNAGQFQTTMDVDVASTSGNSDTTIHPPYGSIFDQRFEQAVGAARDNLDAVEAL